LWKKKGHTSGNRFLNTKVHMGQVVAKENMSVGGCSRSADHD